MITILFPSTGFVYLFSGLPFFLSRHRREFSFTSDIEYVLKRDKNRTLILLRWFYDRHPDSPADPKALLLTLRQKYDRIVYFDDGDSASSDLLHLLPYVDLFLRKQVFRDRSLYLRPQKGNRLFAEYAIDHLGAVDPSEPYPTVENPADLAKIRPAWHLGIGQYPSRHWEERVAQRAFPLLGANAVRTLFHRPRRLHSARPKQAFCQARFTAKGYTPSIGHQRTLLQEKIAGQPRFASGFIDKKAYLAEMESAAAVLSPFGWGEVCYRDFEAFFLGSVLVKPSMDQLETWPDSYRPWQTYAPVRWDGADVVEVVDRVLGDQGLARDLSDRAFDDWSAAFDSLDNRLEIIMQWCHGGKQ